MSTDNIAEVGIDSSGRFYIKPETAKFPSVYRTATEVHWDDKGQFLYSPKPREWSYFDWYRHIVDIIDKEAGCKLKLTSHTKWTDIPQELKDRILEKGEANAQH